MPAEKVKVEKMSTDKMTAEDNTIVEKLTICHSYRQNDR